MKNKVLLSAFALGLAAFAGALHAQTYPTKVIRVVVPFSPGGTSDIIGRTLGQKLSEAWKQPVIMDNRAGVAGSLGASIAAKSPPDGYTLLVGNVGPIAINNQVYNTVGYDLLKDFTPITLAVTAPQIFVVHPSVPAKTFGEFNALVKKHSGKINQRHSIALSRAFHGQLGVHVSAQLPGCTANDTATCAVFGVRSHEHRFTLQFRTLSDFDRWEERIQIDMQNNFHSHSFF